MQHTTEQDTQGRSSDHAAQAAAKRFSRLLDSGWLVTQLQHWRLQAVQGTRPRRTSSPALANLHLCQPSCNSSFEADQAPWAGPRLCELPEQRPALPQRRTGPSGSGAGALHRLRRDWQASRTFGTHLRKQASLTSWGRKRPPCGDKEDAQKSYLGPPNRTP